MSQHLREICHFNPLPPCGGRHSDFLLSIVFSVISIHSLRVEGDKLSLTGTRITKNFNPLPPCGGRLDDTRPAEGVDIFQSTPSVWRETGNPQFASEDHRFQSTPSVWRETMVYHCRQMRCSNFNPLPPCGGRRGGSPFGLPFKIFQSTPSVWRETAKLHSFPLKTQQSKCNFDKKEHRYTSPCQKKYFFSDFFTKKRVRISPAFFVRLGFAPERFLRTKAVPPHRWFPLRRYVPLSSDTDSPDSRTGGYLSRYRWHPSAAV